MCGALRKDVVDGLALPRVKSIPGHSDRIADSGYAWRSDICNGNQIVALPILPCVRERARLVQRTGAIQWTYAIDRPNGWQIKTP